MPGLDLALGQGDDAGFPRLAVETEGGQLGVVGVGRDDHDSLAAEIRLGEDVQAQLTLQPAEARPEVQFTTPQGLGIAAEIDVAPPGDAALEVLAIGFIARAQAHLGIQQAPEPAGAQPTFQEQRQLARRQFHRGQAAMLQMQAQHQGVGGKLVAVVVARRIEEVIGEPGLVAEPDQQRQQRRAPPGPQRQAAEQHDGDDRQDQPLVAAVTFEQGLFAGGHLSSRRR